MARVLVGHGQVPKHNLIWKILLMCACVCNF